MEIITIILNMVSKPIITTNFRELLLLLNPNFGVYNIEMEKNVSNKYIIIKLFF